MEFQEEGFSYLFGKAIAKGREEDHGGEEYPPYPNEGRGKMYPEIQDFKDFQSDSQERATD